MRRTPVLDANSIRSRVEIDPATECWNWTGSVNRAGRAVYGRQYAYRISYEAFVGALDGRQVNHHCDNPRCVNPEHIYAGTQQENVADAVRRSRNVTPTAKRGEEQHRAYPDAIVDEVRARYAAGELQKDLAAEYGISLAAVRVWCSGGARDREPIKRAPAPCATRAGYCAHLRRGEKACAECREANRVYMRAYKDARKSAYSPAENRSAA